MSPVILMVKSPTSTYIQGEHVDPRVQRGHCGRSHHPAPRALGMAPGSECDARLQNRDANSQPAAVGTWQTEASVSTQ